MRELDDDAAAVKASVEDSQAFAAVFERHFDAVHRWLRATAAEHPDDLAAETFVRAFAARGRFVAHGQGDVRAWLFAIAVNLVRDQSRSRRRRGDVLARLVGRDGPPAAPPDALPDPELRAAIAELRAEEREALLLVAWADLSYEQVAHTLGVPVGTVRSRLSRARAQLRTSLAPTPEKAAR